MEKLRLRVQIGMAALLNLGLYQFHSVCFPVLNCHSCPISIFSCPIGIIGQFAGAVMIPLTVIGVIALAGLVAGRFPLWMGLSVRIGPGASVQGSVRKIQHSPMDEIHKIWGVPWTGHCRAVLPQHGVFPLFLSSLPSGHHSVIHTLGYLGRYHQRNTFGDPLGYSLRHHSSCHGPSPLFLQGDLPPGRVSVRLQPVCCDLP